MKKLVLTSLMIGASHVSLAKIYFGTCPAKLHGKVVIGAAAEEDMNTGIISVACILDDKKYAPLVPALAAVALDTIRIPADAQINGIFFDGEKSWNNKRFARRIDQIIYATCEKAHLANCVVTFCDHRSDESCRIL